MYDTEARPPCDLTTHRRSTEAIARELAAGIRPRLFT